MLPFFEYRDHFAGMQQMHQSMNHMMRSFGGGGFFNGDPFGGPPAIGFTDPMGSRRNQQVDIDLKGFVTSI